MRPLRAPPGRRRPRLASPASGRGAWVPAWPGPQRQEVSMGRLDDKVAVISGASSGIGRATMELFGREGATVVGTARREGKLKEALETAGGKGMVVAAALQGPATP